MAQKNKMSALEAFLFAPVNSVTRERLFFNRLYFDLKLAAARRGYALSLFEPDVDRDKFDIVLDDGDNERRIQLKTLLVGASTSTWPTNKRFLRPDIFDGSRLGIVPADCGLGGGVIVIEIEATDDSAPVSYLYSDYFIACMLDMRMILESASAAQTNKKPGRPPQTRKTYAKTLLTELESGGPTDAISLRRQLFVRGKSTDALLALIGLHNTTGCYLPANAIMETARDHFQADQNGIPKAELDRSVVAMAQCWAEDITVLLEEPELQPFTGPVRATETP